MTTLLAWETAWMHLLLLTTLRFRAQDGEPLPPEHVGLVRQLRPSLVADALVLGLTSGEVEAIAAFLETLPPGEGCQHG